MTSYAILLTRMGRYKEAGELYAKALAIQEADLGSKHPDAIHSLYNLGTVLALDDQFDKAIPMLERAVEMNAEVLGVEHHRYAESLAILGLYEASAGRYRVVSRTHGKHLRCRENMPGLTIQRQLC